MTDDNKNHYHLKWWEGIRMTTGNKFIEVCIGCAILMIPFGVMIYLIGKSGLIH